MRIHQGGGQVYIVATDSSQPAIRRPLAWTEVHPSVLPAVKAAFANIVDLPADSGLILTDDFNPVEFYDAHNRELVRRQLALGSREW